MWFQKKPKANPRTNIPAIMAPHNAPDATASTRSAFVAGVPAGVRSKQVTPPLSATNALRLVCKSGAPDEAAEGSVALSVARVPHRPGKWRRAVRRYYTWADLCAVGVRPGDLHVPKLRRSASAAGSDQGPGFDSAGAAGHERALPRAPAAIRGAGVGGGAGAADEVIERAAMRGSLAIRCAGVGGSAGSAGWRGWLARGVIGARDGGLGGGCRVAVGERCV